MRGGPILTKSPEALDMRLPRVRFTVRRLMAVVAALALVLGVSIEAIRLSRQRDRYLKLASENGQSEIVYRTLERSQLALAQIDESSAELSWRIRRPVIPFVYPDDAHIPEKDLTSARIARKKSDDAKSARAQAKLHHETAEYHAGLKQKYLAAAARPWLSLGPDPPPPDPIRRAFFWYQRGDHQRTVSAYREALKIDPTDAWALNGVAWLVATCPDSKYRNGRLAVELATRACEHVQWAVPSYMDTLAAAYAEAGDFGSAVCLEREAVACLPPGDTNQADFRGRLRLYQNNEPFRDNRKNGR
jgi:tetratricopeptide (TPR) repeat protein